MDETETTGPIDDLVERLRVRVEERRAAGDYPEGLEEQLDEHFRRVVFHRAQSRIDPLQETLERFDAIPKFDSHDIAIESGVPGGEILHRAINKAMHRQRQAILDQCSQFADAVREMMHALATATHDPSSHVHGDLVGRIEALVERQNRYEQRIAQLEDALAMKNSQA